MRARREFIFLIGFMASGKTTIGKLFAEEQRMPFYDTDEIIEKKTGMSIPEIFKLKGENAFRKIESQVLRTLIISNLEKYGVIAAGGGMPCFNNNIEVMKKAGIVIYLRAPINDIIARIKDADRRPVFKKEMEKGELRENIRKLLISREYFYKKADIIIDSSSKRTPREIVDDLIYQLRMI